MFDIITFGSATRDVFLRSKGFTEIEEKKFFSGKGICLSLGSKVSIDEIHFLTGGGGTNVAFTFKNQGLKVAFCGMIGDDFSGREILKELKKKGVSTNFLSIDRENPTNYSVIIISREERTILAYRGASGNIQKKHIPWNKLKAKWFYIAPLSGKSLELFEPILRFAQKNKIKIAINPHKKQLSLPKKRFKKLLNFGDVVLLNQEEASLATNLPYHKEKEIFKTLDDWVDGIVVMTKGPFGVVCSDGKWLYKAGILKKGEIVERTGAGDAFGSGFVTGLIKGRKLRLNDQTRIEYALQFGSANATSCLQKLGAKKGLLEKGDNIFKWGNLKISKVKL